MGPKHLPLVAMLATPLAVAAEEVLPPVVVTATRTAQTVDETLASVTVIDRETITRQQPTEFADLLRGQAGIAIAQSGPFGKNTSTYLRGTAAEHTLLLVDGVRMGSATTGAASWQFVAPAEIERVEVVRGPRTSLYGSDAIGGVIQVFTRRGEGPPTWRSFAGGGSFGTREYGAGVSGDTGQTGYAFSASHFQTDGIDALEAGDDDLDGYHNTSASARLSHTFANGLELFATTLRSQGATEFDGTVDRTEFVQQASSAGVQGSVTPQWWSQLTLAHSRDESDNFSDGDFFSQFDTLRDTANWQNDITLDRHLLTIGADYQLDRVDSNTEFDQTSRYNRGAYGQILLDLGLHVLSGSVRYDDNEAFGDKTTAQVAWGYEPTPGWRTRTSYGTAFRAPDFNDLYYPFEDFGAYGNYQGNPDLRPEESETYELGLRYDAPDRYLDLAVFDTTVDNLIEIAGFPEMRPQNVSEASIKGIEVAGGLHVGAWRSDASVTFLEHEDTATGNALRRRPQSSARVAVDRDLNALSVGFTVAAEGSRYDDAANADQLPGYALLDLRAAYRLAPEWTLQATVKNALNKDYETVKGYNQPGRAAYVSVRYRP